MDTQWYTQGCCEETRKATEPCSAPQSAFAGACAGVRLGRCSAAAKGESKDLMTLQVVGPRVVVLFYLQPEKRELAVKLVDSVVKQHAAVVVTGPTKAKTVGAAQGEDSGVARGSSRIIIFCSFNDTFLVLRQSPLEFLKPSHQVFVFIFVFALLLALVLVVVLGEALAVAFAVVLDLALARWQPS